MANSPEQPKVVILYDTKSEGGSTDRFIDKLGMTFAETGAYVEKVKCKTKADYSFVHEFDIVVMGAPVYYLVVSSELLGAIIQSNLRRNLRRKNIALFLTCGSPEPMANLLYMPQMKAHLLTNKILEEKVFAPNELSDDNVVSTYVNRILRSHRLATRNRNASMQWSDEALDMLDQIPSFFRNRVKTATEEYAEEMGYTTITLDVIDEAKAQLEG